MSPTLFKILIVAAMVCQQLGYIVGGEAWGKFNGATHVLLSVTILLVIWRNNALIRADKWSKILPWYLFAAATNQFVDEAFFNPQVFGVNEWFILAFIITHAIATLLRDAKRTYRT